MNFMEATKENEQTSNEIIEIFHKRNLTVEEAYSILDHVRGRIKYTSKVAPPKN